MKSTNSHVFSELSTMVGYIIDILEEAEAPLTEREIKILRLKLFQGKKLEDIGSVRVINNLKSEIVTLGDLVRTPESELKRRRHFGKKSVDEVKEFLRLQGLKLGMHV